jgi:hypothetical protein
MRTHRHPVHNRTPGFIEISCDAPLGDGYREMAGAGKTGAQGLRIARGLPI